METTTGTKMAACSSRDQLPKQQPNPSNDNDKYEVICEIGKGSFGKVNKIRRKADGKILVWKEIKYGAMSEREK